MSTRSRIIPLLTAFLIWIPSARLGAQEPATPPPAAAAPAAEAKYPLRQILIGESLDAAQQLAPVPDAGFVVVTPALSALNLGELTKRLVGGENVIIDDKLIASVAQVVANLAHQQNFPQAIAMVPVQSLAAGVLRVALVLNPPVIHHILVGASVDDVMKLSPGPDAGFIVLSPALPMLKSEERFAKRLAQSENQIFQEKLVAAIAQVVEIYAKQSDFPIANVVVPPQNASDGTLRVVLQLGKIRNIRMAGNRWFSESLLLDKLRIENGETLRMSDLDSAISWTNNNAFRRVHVQINPIANTGEADLIVAVQEVLPLRLATSYDNSGNSIIGNNRFTASVAYANLWGLDHQASYQFITTDLGPRIFQGHGIDYRVPLPWRDYIQFSASYVRLSADVLEGVFHQNGETFTSDLHYTHPIRTGDSPIEVYAGIDFKTSDNDLAFYGIPVPLNKTDIFQFTAGGSGISRDKRGAWAYGANVNLSPGRFNSLNSGTAFDEARALAKPYYAYGQLTFQRLLNLQPGWDFTSRGIVQISDGNLLASEQLFIGGGSSVRGFKENVFGGDEGFLFTNELAAPSWQRKLPGLPKNRNVLETRLVAFYDAGQVREKHTTNLDPIFRPLAGTGVGVRMGLASNFTLAADYGWQITHLPYAHDDHGRGNIKVTLAY